MRLLCHSGKSRTRVAFPLPAAPPAVALGARAPRACPWNNTKDLRRWPHALAPRSARMVDASFARSGQAPEARSPGRKPELWLSHWGAIQVRWTIWKAQQVWHSSVGSFRSPRIAFPHRSSQVLVKEFPKLHFGTNSRMLMLIPLFGHLEWLVGRSSRAKNLA